MARHLSPQHLLQIDVNTDEWELYCNTINQCRQKGLQIRAFKEVVLWFCPKLGTNREGARDWYLERIAYRGSHRKT